MTAAIQVEVYGPDGITLIAAVPRHTGAQWLDELNGDGSGQFSIHLDDPLLTTYPALLDGGNIVKLAPTGQAAAFAFHIEDVTPTLTASGGRAENWVTVSGRGVRTLLQLGVVYPEYGLRATTSDDRAFDFSSAEGDWYDSAEWVTPQAVTLAADTSFRGTKGPEGWPDPGAEWIWSTDPTADATAGRNWFRGSFTLASPANIAIYGSSDNWMNLRLNGDTIIETDMDDRYAWAETYKFSAYLPAGTHLIAAAVDNYDSNGDNPAGFLCSVMYLDASGKPTSSVLRTSAASFKVRGYGDPPGWNGAQIVRALLAECQARGASPLDPITTDFTGAVDSDGQAWEDLQDRAFDVNTDLLDVLTQVSEIAFDSAMTPDLVLHAWKQRGADLSATIELVAGEHILAQTPTLRHGPVRNCGIVRFGSGWLEVDDPASVAAYGRRETGLSVGNAQSTRQAQRVADALFFEIATPQVTLPLSITSATGPQPYDDFDLGDTITAPGVFGTPGAARVMSIAASDAGGYIAWDLDLYPEA